MKRIIALITCSLLALACLSSFAEEAPLTCESIAEAALAQGSPLAYAGVAALLVSAVFTAAYLLTICVRAYFPPADFEPWSLKSVKEANLYMTLPLILLTAAIVLLGCFPGALQAFIDGVVPAAFPGL